MTAVSVRKFVTLREEILREGGRPADGESLIKVVSAAVVANPAPVDFQEDVLSNVPASVEVGHAIVEHAFAALAGVEVESYGKGAIVGTDGDQEQAVSFLTTDFGNTLRDAVDGREWVSSVTKRGGPGTTIDIPLAHKDVLQARSHYDAATISIPDAPRADELVIVIAVATRGRLNERAGGLTVAEGVAAK